ncbi:MAG: hypothetical protein HOP17_06170 [Acidobacteria bacterium]|nr:hypothetical protein [Acidobacteriota bacterium]
MKKLVFIAASLFLLTFTGFAQPRPVDKGAAPVVRAQPAPTTFEAKYEGGLFGFTQKEEGTLKFDDENQRIVFLGKDKKERFGIPYKSLSVVSPQSRSVTSNTGNVVGAIPLPGAGILGGFIKEKRRYMLVQFSDPDAEVRGTTSFKVENKELLDSVIQTLGEKAQLKQRGDAYYRPRPKTTEI